MATTGYSDLKEFQRVEVVVSPHRPSGGEVVTGPSAGVLGPAERTEAMAAMRTADLDILVVGGGIVGAGRALDAATRGLSVGMVEARDWASGTSSRSSKLIHGGLRYLEMLDFAPRARGAARARADAHPARPHLVRPVPFLYPLQAPSGSAPTSAPGSRSTTLMARTGDASAGVPLHRHLTRARRCARRPACKDAFVGACSTTTPRSTTPGTW